MQTKPEKDRLDDITTSFLDMDFEQRMERVKDIRRGRVTPAKQKPVRKASAKKRTTKLASLIGNMSPAEIARLKAQLGK